MARIGFRLTAGDSTNEKLKPYQQHQNKPRWRDCKFILLRLQSRLALPLDNKIDCSSRNGLWLKFNSNWKAFDPRGEFARELEFSRREAHGEGRSPLSPDVTSVWLVITRPPSTGPSFSRSNFPFPSLSMKTIPDTARSAI